MCEPSFKGEFTRGCENVDAAPTGGDNVMRTGACQNYFRAALAVDGRPWNIPPEVLVMEIFDQLPARNGIETMKEAKVPASLC